MNQIANTAVLHLDLLDLLILVRAVPIWPTLVELALRLPVVAFDRGALLLAVCPLADRLFLLQLQHHVLVHVHLHALLIKRCLEIALEMPRVLLIKNGAVLLLGQVVDFALLRVVRVHLLAMVSLLVQHRELLLELPVVLASRVAAPDLLHRLPLGAQFQRVDRACLISVASTILVMAVLVVRGGLGLPFGAVPQFLLRRSILTDLLLLQVHELYAHAFRAAWVPTCSLALHVVRGRGLARLVGSASAAALDVAESLREGLRGVLPVVFLAGHCQVLLGEFAGGGHGLLLFQLLKHHHVGDLLLRTLEEPIDLALTLVLDRVVTSLDSGRVDGEMASGAIVFSRACDHDSRL